MSGRSVYQAAGHKEDTRGIAKRVAQISVSAIKQMPVLASKIPGCISLGQGIPSFPTPEFIREAIIKELQHNEAIGKYSLQPGLPELKLAVAKDLERRHGIRHVDPEREIFISCGGMEALAASLATIVERGDEVIVPSPNYSSHLEQILFAEGRPVFVPLIEEEGWKMDLDALRQAITKKTKAILFCSPANPTGAVFSRTELQTIADLALKHKLFLLVDEAYDFLVYDNNPYFSVASIPELKDNLVAVYSFSKRFCMTGWRVGYLYASSRIVDQVLKVHDAFAICAPTISQYAALIALQHTNGKTGLGDQSVTQLIHALEKRREVLCQRLTALPELFSFQKPKGAYYIFPKIVPKNLNSIDLALKLLYEAKVITVPGSGFGPTGEGHVRLSFGGTEEQINKALDRIETWVKKQKL